MDPTIHQIIFPRIIMLARKVAADLCLPSQSLPCIFMYTIRSRIRVTSNAPAAETGCIMRSGGQDDISSEFTGNREL